jgi:hypothetical protein
MSFIRFHQALKKIIEFEIMLDPILSPNVRLLCPQSKKLAAMQPNK